MVIKLHLFGSQNYKEDTVFSSKNTDFTLHITKKGTKYPSQKKAKIAISGLTSVRLFGYKNLNRVSVLFFKWNI